MLGTPSALTLPTATWAPVLSCPQGHTEGLVILSGPPGKEDSLFTQIHSALDRPLTLTWAGPAFASPQLRPTASWAWPTSGTMGRGIV